MRYLLLLLFLSLPVQALTEREGQFVMQCTLKTIAFGVGHHEYYIHKGDPVKAMTEQLVRDGAPQQVVVLWAGELHAALEQEDYYLMLRNTLIKCMERGF